MPPHCHFENITVSKQRAMKEKKASWDLEMARNSVHQERLDKSGDSTVSSSVSKKTRKAQGNEVRKIE